VARAGVEHLAVHEVVHSLTYFYNWCFAQVETTYSWKWDGGMVLTTRASVRCGTRAGRCAGSRSSSGCPGTVRTWRTRGAFLDLGWRNREEEGFPTGPDLVYAKAFEWEIRQTPNYAYAGWPLPDLLCVELEHLHGDEFAHRTVPASFASSWHNQRKRREWEFRARCGSGPDGVVEVTAPPGVHVVDHVTRTWLPAARRGRPDGGRPGRECDRTGVTQGTSTVRSGRD